MTLFPLYNQGCPNHLVKPISLTQSKSKRMKLIFYLSASTMANMRPSEAEILDRSILFLNFLRSLEICLVIHSFSRELSVMLGAGI